MESSDGSVSKGGSWPQRLAPIAAAAVLLAGVALLVARSGAGDEPPPPVGGGASVATAPEPEAPRLETTTIDPSVTPPAMTAPPLVEPGTTAAATTPPETTTTPAATAATTPAPDMPTQEDIDRVLLSADDLQGTWTEEVVDTDSVCGDNPELANTIVEGAVLFQQLNVDPTGVRQLGHNILSFADAATAERAFTADLELLEACSATTVELDGVEYRVDVISDAFDEEQASTFPCSDQNASAIIQLTNDAAVVPYIGQSAFSFRCGSNITVTSLTTTIGVADLSQNEFFVASATTNTRTALLAGSS